MVLFTQMPLPGNPIPLDTNSLSDANIKPGEMQGRIYFFQQPSGKIIFVNEDGAWNMYSKRPQIVGRYVQPFKFLGSSDGSIYRQAINEAGSIFREKGLVAAQERLRQAEKEEFEKAKGVMTPPRNLDRKDLQGQPVNKDGERI